MFYTVLASLVFTLMVAGFCLYSKMRGRVLRLAWLKFVVILPLLLLGGVWACFGAYWLGFAALLSGTAVTLLLSPVPVAVYGLTTWGIVRWMRGKPYTDAVVIVVIMAFMGGVYGAQRAWLCEPLAHNGVGRAQLCTAKLYEQGRGGVISNFGTARGWYEKAAGQRVAEAEFWIGMHTPGVEKKQWLMRAAKQGYAPAAYRLYMLLGPEGDDGLEWLRFAAREGNPDAMYRLGWLHMSGHKVRRDLGRTRELWNRAAENGSVSAMRSLALAYARAGVLYDHDPEASRRFEREALAAEADEDYKQLAAGERWLAKTWQTGLADLRRQQAAADRGDVAMRGQIGHDILSHAKDDPQLRARGIAWLERAARAGDGEAQYEVADYYLTYEPASEKISKKGRQWLIRAADGGHRQALYRVIEGYKQGREGFDADLYAAKRYSELLFAALKESGVKQNDPAWLSLAWDYDDTLKQIQRSEERYLPLDQLQAQAAAGDPVAQYHLAKKVELDPTGTARALRLLAAAANGGFAQAQYEMARRIRNRKRTNEEERQAIAWLRAAVDSGHRGAMLDLGTMYLNGLPRQQVERNYYQAKVLFKRAMEGRELIVYEQRTGEGRGWHVTAAHVKRWLERIPDFIMRLDLEDLHGAARRSALASWYERERGALVAKAKTARGDDRTQINNALVTLEMQRDLLLDADDQPVARAPHPDQPALGEQP
ncbi:MAG: hypothetical protein ABFS02_06755 [Pseudomonadota bacterium]